MQPYVPRAHISFSSIYPVPSNSLNTWRIPSTAHTNRWISGTLGYLLAALGYQCIVCYLNKRPRTVSVALFDFFLLLKQKKSMKLKRKLSWNLCAWKNCGESNWCINFLFFVHFHLWNCGIVWFKTVWDLGHTQLNIPNIR